jgi:hypothetical protein
MDNTDFDIFKQEISWFIKPTDKIELTKTELNFSDNFISTFPTLYKLVSQARILGITLTRQNENTYYKLLSWTNKENLKSGWLCKFDKQENEIVILQEHQLLVDNIGGIQESYKQLETDKEILTDNQNFLFIKSECTNGIGGWDEYYEDMCKEYEKPQIDFKEFICFVQEANGDVTLYDRKTKEVMLFAHDHCFENVEFLENQPEYTFHKINGITNFIDYAETLAHQWLDNIVENN